MVPHFPPPSPPPPPPPPPSLSSSSEEEEEERGEENVEPSLPPPTPSVLSRLPPRLRGMPPGGRARAGPQATGRADAARVVRIAKQQGGTKSNRAAYNNVSEAGTDLVEAKRGNAKAADLSNRKSRVVSGLVKLEKKPTAAAQKPPPKPSPYAQSGGGGNPQRLVGGKPRSAALQRRLSKINGRG